MIGVYLNGEGKDSFSVGDLKNFLLKQDAFKSTQTVNAINQVFAKMSSATKETVRSEFTRLFKRALSEGALNEFKLLMDQVKTERYGWRIELNAAMALNFPSNDFNVSYVPKYGFWTSVSYRPFKKTADNLKVPKTYEFIGLARWLNGNQQFDERFNSNLNSSFKSGSTFDFGIHFVKEFNRLSTEVEYIYRSNQNEKVAIVNGEEFTKKVNDDTYKLVFNLNYKVNSSLVFSYNIGKNFDMPTLTNKQLISGFTVNFAFGKITPAELAKLAANKALD